MTTNNRNRFVDGVVAAAIVIAYAASRFVGLTKLPVFIDEATFIHYARGVFDGHPFGTLPFGKLLHVWLMALVVPWAPDTLWAVRAITVLAGGLALYACFQIGARLYNRQAGLVCAALYVICPFTLFHDRIALADGLLSALAALTLLWSIALVQDDRWFYALLLGLAMAGATLSKIPGLLTLLTPLCTVILLAKPPRIRLARQLALSYCITLALTVLPVVSFLQTTHESELSVVGQNAATILRQVSTNIQTAYEWLWFYWTPPVLILGIAGFVLAIITRKREHLLLGTISLLPILAFAVVSKIWFPRYLLPATVPVLALVAGIVTSKKGAADWTRLFRLTKFAPKLQALPSIVFLVLVGLFAYRVDWLLLTNPARAPLPAVERIQYIEAWPSGYGIAEAANFLHQAAELKEEGIVVVHHDWRDTIEFGLKAYLLFEKRIEFRWADLQSASELAKIVASSGSKPTFVVLNRPPLSQVPEKQPNVAELLKVAYLVRSYPRPGGGSAVDVYFVGEP